MVVNGSSLLLVRVFLEFRVVGSKTRSCEFSIGKGLSVGREARWEDFAVFAAFLFLDVIHVGVSVNSNNS